jgi:hypothetical protein
VRIFHTFYCKICFCHCIVSLLVDFSIWCHNDGFFNCFQLWKYMDSDAMEFIIHDFSWTFL